jgi:hypothetical protein
MAISWQTFQPKNTDSYWAKVTLKNLAATKDGNLIALCERSGILPYTEGVVYKLAIGNSGDILNPNNWVGMNSRKVNPPPLYQGTSFIETDIFISQAKSITSLYSENYYVNPYFSKGNLIPSAFISFGAEDMFKGQISNQILGISGENSFGVETINTKTASVGDYIHGDYKRIKKAVMINWVSPNSTRSIDKDNKQYSPAVAFIFSNTGLKMNTIQVVGLTGWTPSANKYQSNYWRGMWGALEGPGGGNYKYTYDQLNNAPFSYTGNSSNINNVMSTFSQSVDDIASNYPKYYSTDTNSVLYNHFMLATSYTSNAVAKIPLVYIDVNYNKFDPTNKIQYSTIKTQSSSPTGIRSITYSASDDIFFAVPNGIDSYIYAGSGDSAGNNNFSWTQCIIRSGSTSSPVPWVTGGVSCTCDFRDSHAFYANGKFRVIAKNASAPGNSVLLEAATNLSGLRITGFIVSPLPISQNLRKDQNIACSYISGRPTVCGGINEDGSILYGVEKLDQNVNNLYFPKDLYVGNVINLPSFADSNLPLTYSTPDSGILSIDNTNRTIKLTFPGTGTLRISNDGNQIYSPYYSEMPLVVKNLTSGINSGLNWKSYNLSLSGSPINVELGNNRGSALIYSNRFSSPRFMHYLNPDITNSNGWYPIPGGLGAGGSGTLMTSYGGGGGVMGGVYQTLTSPGTLYWYDPNVSKWNTSTPGAGYAFGKSIGTVGLVFNNGPAYSTMALLTNPDAKAKYRSLVLAYNITPNGWIGTEYNPSGFIPNDGAQNDFYSNNPQKTIMILTSTGSNKTVAFNYVQIGGVSDPFVGKVEKVVDPSINGISAITYDNGYELFLATPNSSNSNKLYYTSTGDLWSSIQLTGNYNFSEAKIIAAYGKYSIFAKDLSNRSINLSSFSPAGPWIVSTGITPYSASNQIIFDRAANNKQSLFALTTTGNQIVHASFKNKSILNNSALQFLKIFDTNEPQIGFQYTFPSTLSSLGYQKGILSVSDSSVLQVSNTADGNNCPFKFLKRGPVTLTIYATATEAFEELIFEKQFFVGKSQTVSYNVPADVSLGSQYSLSLSSSAGLPVDYTCSDSNTATISNGKLTIIGPGRTATITVSQGGDGTYNPYVAYYTITTPKANQNISYIDKQLLLSKIESPAKVSVGSSYAIPSVTAEGLPLSWSSASNNVSLSANNLIRVTDCGAGIVSASNTGNLFYNPFAYNFVVSSNPFAEAALRCNQISTISLPRVGFIDAVYSIPPYAISQAGNPTSPLTYRLSNSGIARLLYNDSQATGLRMTGYGNCTVFYNATQNPYFNNMSGQSSINVYKNFQSFSYNVPTGITVGAVYSLSTTSSAGLPMSYSSLNSGVVSIVNNYNLVATGAGSTSIIAYQSGSNAYEPINTGILVLAFRTTQTGIGFKNIPKVTAPSTSYQLPEFTSAGIPIVYSSLNTGIARIRIV